MKNQQDQAGMSRRDFLKTAAAVGAVLTIQPTFEKVQAAEAVINTKERHSGPLPRRVLGTGRAAMEVSALGFGVMGMTYNCRRDPRKISDSWGVLQGGVRGRGKSRVA